MKSLKLRDQIAQLVVIPFSGQALNLKSKLDRDFINLVKKTHVGGLILVNVSQGHLVQRADPATVAGIVNRIQKYARVPLIVSGDLERGASMRFNDTTIFPHAMAFAAAHDPAAARYEGEITAREARAIGLQWVFYPVADVNNNPDNPIINIRSFGENPADVSEYVKAFIQGANQDPRHRLLTTAKHFPGHGDTSVDSHLNLATITGDKKRLSEVELVPFRAAIAAGVDSVMTAHIAVPALDSAETPATLSRAIITDLLRDELNFHGLVVTDALEMGGIAKGFGGGEAAVKALEAGADVLLMPTDPVEAIDAVYGAVKSGRITRERILQSVSRLLAAKARVGLGAQKLVNVKAIPKLVNTPEANARAQQIAERAVTLVKNERQLVPLRDAAKACFVVLKEGNASVQGQAFTQELQARVPAAKFMTLDSHMEDAELSSYEQQLQPCEALVVSAFASVAAYRGNVALGGGFPALVDRLIATRKPLVFVALGNPYLLRNFPGVSAYLTTFSTVPPSEIAAVRALIGVTAITGKLPITIPGLAQYGDGIQVPLAER